MDFADEATQALGFLERDLGFRLTASSAEEVVFESNRVVVRATFYPSDHGQLDVTAAPIDGDDPYAAFVVGGMVGRASAARVLELAAEKLAANAPALLGDEAYFERLGEQRRRESEAWTAFYSGKGPQPTGRLP